jgi:hypothetical protein
VPAPGLVKSNSRKAARCISGRVRRSRPWADRFSGEQLAGNARLREIVLFFANMFADGSVRRAEGNKAYVIEQDEIEYGEAGRSRWFYTLAEDIDPTPPAARSGAGWRSIIRRWGASWPARRVSPADGARGAYRRHPRRAGCRWLFHLVHDRDQCELVRTRLRAARSGLRFAS